MTTIFWPTKLTYILDNYECFDEGRRGHYHMVIGLLHMASVPITTDFVRSNPAQTRCTRYDIM